MAWSAVPSEKSRQMAMYKMPSQQTKKQIKINGKKRYGISVSWDNYDECVDIDLQAVIVDHLGMIADAVYYNNLDAMRGSVISCGDADHADGNSTDEVIWVNFRKLPADVALIVFVVAAHTEHAHLGDILNGKIKLMQNDLGGIVHTFKMEDTMEDVDVVCAMKRVSGDDWKFFEIDDVAMQGSHFLDILEPTIGDVIRKFIPGAPLEQAVSFTMKKGAICDFGLSDKLRRLNICIGGTARKGSPEVDLDITAVVLSEDGRMLGAVTGDKAGKYGISHSGDTAAEAMDGLAEAMTVDLLSIPKAVGQVIFVLNVFNPGGTFKLVRRAFVKITDQDCNSLAKHEIKGCEDENGLIVGRIFRAPGSNKRWGFQALGRFCHGPTWKDAMKELTKLFSEPPHEDRAAAGGPKPLPFSCRYSMVPDGQWPAKDKQKLEIQTNVAPTFVDEPGVYTPPARASKLRKPSLKCVEEDKFLDNFVQADEIEDETKQKFGSNGGPNTVAPPFFDITRTEWASEDSAEAVAMRSTWSASATSPSAVRRKIRCTARKVTQEGPVAVEQGDEDFGHCATWSTAIESVGRSASVSSMGSMGASKSMCTRQVSTASMASETGTRSGSPRSPSSPPLLRRRGTIVLRASEGSDGASAPDPCLWAREDHLSAVLSESRPVQDEEDDLDQRNPKACASCTPWVAGFPFLTACAQPPR